MDRVVDELGEKSERLLTTADLAGYPAFRLSEATVRPDLRTIAGPSGTVTLEPRAIQVLLVLVDAGGAVVTRDMLERRCWGGVFVSDDSINRAVAMVRRAARDSGAGFEIETIPRTGYRLVADLIDAQSAGPETPTGAGDGAASIPGIADPAGIGRRRVVVAGAVMAVAAVGGALLLRDRASNRDVERLMAESADALRLATPEADQQAAGLLRQAVAREPDHADAWGRLSLALRLVAEFVPPDAMQSAQREAREAADRALALDPTQPDARAALALLDPPFGNWIRQDRALAAILADTPDHLPTLDGLAFLWAGAGLVGAHFPLRLRTIEADPRHAGYAFRSIYSHWMIGNVPAADRAAARAMELWPKHFAVWLARLSLLGFGGRPERALAMLNETETAPDLPQPFLDLFRGVFLSMMADTESPRLAAAEQVLGAVQQAGPVLAVHGSLMLAGLGAVKPAMDIVTAYLVERGPVMASISWKPGQIMHNDIRRRLTNHLFLPPMAPVRAMPEFLPLMADIGLQDYWDATGRAPDRP